MCEPQLEAQLFPRHLCPWGHLILKEWQIPIFLNCVEPNLYSILRFVFVWISILRNNRCVCSLLCPGMKNVWVVNFSGYVLRSRHVPRNIFVGIFCLCFLWRLIDGWNSINSVFLVRKRDPLNNPFRKSGAWEFRQVVFLWYNQFRIERLRRWVSDMIIIRVFSCFKLRDRSDDFDGWVIVIKEVIVR